MDHGCNIWPSMSSFTTILCPVHDTKKCPCKTTTSTFSLFSAAQFNDAETVKRTLSRFPHKANLQDDYGYTPLHYAAQAGALQAVTALLAAGAHVDGIPDGGCGATPLHRAAFAGRTQVCQVLLEHGANVNAIDSSFGDLRTPLLKAVSQGNVSVIELLLRAGADVHAVDAQGLGLLDICPNNDHRVREQLRTLLPEAVREEARSKWISTHAQPVEESQLRHGGRDEEAKQGATKKEPEASPRQPAATTMQLGLVCSTCGEVLLVARKRAGKMYCSVCYSALNTSRTT